MEKIREMLKDVPRIKNIRLVGEGEINKEGIIEEPMLVLDGTGKQEETRHRKIPFCHVHRKNADAVIWTRYGEGRICQECLKNGSLRIFTM